VVHLYASLIEDLVTHGYVVVAIDHTYDAAVVTMLDGGTAYANTSWQPSDTADASTMWDTYDQHIETWVADARFVLDQVTTWQSADPQGLVTGRLDLDRVGMFGHSYGGATAAQCCALDARFKAGINLEGTLFSPGEPTSAPPSRSPSCCS
jgi:predicted dienelactone hydrolase